MPQPVLLDGRTSRIVCGVRLLADDHVPDAGGCAEPDDVVGHDVS